MRVGFGYDVHRLQRRLPLIIGGINIPHKKGAVGHSDADALIHAICDALLGAANLRDIGWHFSDKDPKYKGIDSKLLLAETANLLTQKKYKIINLDTTICLQEPKIGHFIPEMQTILANVLNITTNQLSIKATTTERLGFVGKTKGIAAYAVALIDTIN